MTRPPTPAPLVLGSLVAAAALVAGLWWREQPTADAPNRPLIVYAAPAVRLPLEALASDYARDTGRPVELRIGPSEDILTKVRFPSPGAPADLFIPADDSYIVQARQRGLIADSFPVAPMRAVVLLAPGNPKQLANWNDLPRDGVRVAVPNPGAAVGKLARSHLVATGTWSALAPRAVDVGTVTEAANAARLGSADAAIVWDAVAAGPAYRGQIVLEPAELSGVTGRVEVAVLAQSPDPAAARAFAEFVARSNHGRDVFRRFGFRVPPTTNDP